MPSMAFYEAARMYRFKPWKTKDPDTHRRLMYGAFVKRDPAELIQHVGAIGLKFLSTKTVFGAHELDKDKHPELSDGTG